MLPPGDMAPAIRPSDERNTTMASPGWKTERLCWADGSTSNVVPKTLIVSGALGEGLQLSYQTLIRVSVTRIAFCSGR